MELRGQFLCSGICPRLIQVEQDGNPSRGGDDLRMLHPEEPRAARDERNAIFEGKQIDDERCKAHRGITSEGSPVCIDFNAARATLSPLAPSRADTQGVAPL